jgi:hypothetical protein
MIFRDFEENLFSEDFESEQIFPVFICKNNFIYHPKFFDLLLLFIKSGYQLIDFCINYDLGMCISTFSNSSEKIYILTYQKREKIEREYHFIVTYKDGKKERKRKVIVNLLSELYPSKVLYKDSKNRIKEIEMEELEELFIEHLISELKKILREPSPLTYI